MHFICGSSYQQEICGKEFFCFGYFPTAAFVVAELFNVPMIICAGYG